MTITFDPVLSKADQPFSVKISGMPNDDVLTLAFTDPDGNEIAATLGEVDDTEFETRQSQHEPGTYVYSLKDADEVLVSASIDVTP